MIEFFRALRAGAVVSDPTNLKRKQQMLDAIMVLLGIAVTWAGKAGYAIELSADDQMAVAGGILALYSAISGMLSAASTDKIGILPAASRTDSVDGSSGN
jgi:hypothetical protein